MLRFFAWLFRKKPREVKLGLALGSGGAKGFAELGALKAFEENGINFDYVAGTSIGSIIGAFYADGYSSEEIGELLNKVDQKEIKSTIMIGMDTIGLFNVIDRNIGHKNIEDLKKSFKAVATEVTEGKEWVFDKGSVAKALCASSCFPPFFKPVVIGDDRFVDGAFSNSVPADLVKKMGADYVVGIDLRNYEAKPSLLSKIFPTYSGKVKEPWKKGYDFSDIMIKPDLKNYKSTDFKYGKQMYKIGYEYALKAVPEIKDKIEQLKHPKKKAR